MKQRTIAAALLAALAGAGISGTVVSAQSYSEQAPVYTTWQRDWDGNQYDQRHVVLGYVAGFSAYRVTVQRDNGMIQTVDLKNGTLIYPTGATPTQGERAAMVGYYSNGTFVANRVVLRP